MKIPKVYNLSVQRGPEGGKHLDLQIHGVIDGGWWDDGESVNTAAVIAQLQEHRDAATIRARINSVGGSAFGGIALYNALQSHGAQVECIVEGLAASAASVIAMAGTTKICPGAMLMIHSPWTMAQGNAEELRKTADMLDKLRDALGEIYSAKTGKSADEIRGMLDAETWMTAAEAVEAGFADVAVEHEPAAGDPEPDPADPDEGKEGEGEAKARIVWAGVKFPAGALPERIAAMAPAVKPAPQAAQPQPAPAPAPAPGAPAPTSPAAPAAAVLVPLTREQLAAQAPALLAALLAEGRAEGARAERERLQEIDGLKLSGPGVDEIVAAAKFGAEPQTAAELALAVLRSGRNLPRDLLARRRDESGALRSVTPSASDGSAAVDQAKTIAAITAGGNARRG